jgi:hypothetical protein
MSSDNFYLIRRAGTRYAVTDESESARMELSSEDPMTSALAGLSSPAPIDSLRIAWFDDESAASTYAHGEYSEYGVETDTSTDASTDTYASRLARLLRTVAALVPDGSVVQSNHHEANAATLHWGPYDIRVDGPSFEAAASLAAAIEYVCLPNPSEQPPLSPRVLRAAPDSGHRGSV